jgi:hypothetical protein
MDTLSLRLCFLNLLFFCCCVGNVCGQIIQGSFLQKEIDDHFGEDYRIFPYSERGLLLVQVSSTENRKRFLQLDFLDTALLTLWSKRIDLSGYINSIDFYAAKTDFFVLITRERHQYEVHKTKIFDGYTEMFKLGDFKKFYVSHFVAQDSLLFLAGQLFDKPTLFFVNLRSGKTIAPASPSLLSAFISHLCIDTLNHQIWAVFKSRESSSKEQLYFNSFSFSGEPKAKVSIPKSQYYQPVQFRFVTGAADSSLTVLGSYAHRSESLVQGLFFWKLHANKLKIEKYHDFAFFDNYFRYLSDNKREKIKLRAQKKRARGQNFTIRQRLMLHQPLMTPEGNILCLAETYQGIPRSSTLPNYPYYYPYRRYDYYARPPESIYSQSSTGAFVPPFTTYPDHSNEKDSWGEYRYEQMQVVCFSQKGDKIWDNGMVFNNLSEKYPVELSSAVYLADSIFMLYTDGKEIFYKVSAEKKFENTNLSLNFDDPEVIVDVYTNGGMSWWYGKNFIQAGLREQRGQTQSIFKAKRYFYVSKLSLLRQ